MVTKSVSPQPARLRGLTALITAYVVVVVATLAVLGLLSATAPSHAPSQAWGHAIVVSAFAVLLPVRLHAARRGSPTARRAVGIVCAVLAVINLVEAAIPGAFPAWMRVEMVLIAGLMAFAVRLAVRAGSRA